MLMVLIVRATPGTANDLLVIRIISAAATLSGRTRHLLVEFVINALARATHNLLVIRIISAAATRSGSTRHLLVILVVGAMAVVCDSQGSGMDRA